MGLKSGSRDAGLDGDEAEDDRPDDGAPSDDPAGGDGTDGSADADGATAAEGESDPGGSSAATDADRPTVASLPYKLRRSKVNEGRSQVPFFLREEVLDAESDLQDALEAMLDETVYKSDYREAGMIVAQRNPELVAAVLREWGYDLDQA